jgi:predicted aspartyl protease
MRRPESSCRNGVRQRRPLLSLCLIAFCFCTGTGFDFGNLIGSLSGSNCSAQDASRRELSNSTPLVDFPVAPHGGILIVPVETLETSQQLLVDTGSQYCVLDRQFWPYLGPGNRYIVDGVGGATEVVFCHSPQFRLGQLDVSHDEPVLLLDMAPIRTLARKPIAGILGMTAMKHRIVQIDFDAGRFRMLDRLPETKDSRTAPATFPLSWKDGLPRLNLVCGTAGPELFDIDTGHGGELSLTQELYDSLVQAGEIEHVGEVHVETSSGEIRELEGRLSRLKLGDFEHKDIIVRRSNSCLLGLDYLARYELTLNFPQSRVLLKPSRAFNRPSAKRRFGKNATGPAAPSVEDANGP